MLEPAENWDSKFGDLPIVDTAKKGLENVGDLLVDFMSDIEISAPASQEWKFEFNKTLFVQSALTIITIGKIELGALALSKAWNLAILGTVPLPVGAGAITDPPSPATCFAAPPIIALVPASVEVGTMALSKAITNIKIPESKEELPTTFGSTFRTAAGFLKYTLSGVNKVSPPAGPQPITTIAGVI